MVMVRTRQTPKKRPLEKRYYVTEMDCGNYPHCRCRMRFNPRTRTIYCPHDRQHDRGEAAEKRRLQAAGLWDEQGNCPDYARMMAKGGAA